MAVKSFVLAEDHSFHLYLVGDIKKVLGQQTDVAETLQQLRDITAFAIDSIDDEGVATIDHPYAW